MNRPDGDPARPHTVAPGAYVFRLRCRVTPELRRGRPIRARVPTESRIRVPSPESRSDVHRSVVGSALPSPRRRLVVRASPRRLDREGRRHVRRRGADGRRTNAGGGTRRPSWTGRAGPACGSRPRPRGPRRRRGTASIEVIAEAASDRDRRVARRGGSAARSAVRHAWSTRCSRPCPSMRREPVVQRTAETQGRMLMASDAEVRAAAVVVTSVLRHELIARARAGAAIRRESPITWLQKDGTMIEGVLDLAFEENGVTDGRRLQDRPRTGRRRGRATARRCSST